MIFGYFTLFVALLIEVVGAYYSITGLAAIFSGAVIPILIMGGVLELGKVTAAVWLKNNWYRASVQFKAYLLPAVIMLMLITSMGIFGFLSKAHNDQNLVSGDVQGKIAIYDEKIKTAKENIEADRKQLKQMDEAVDQVMARSTSEEGATKANAIRKSQQRDRSALAKDIETQQKLIATLNDEASPIRAEVRKVEAEVGPIKYIAKLLYDDNPDANILEKAVTWMILIIVAVFDPLALVLILAAQQSIRWAQGEEKKDYEPDDGSLTDDQLSQIKEQAGIKEWFGRARERARFWDSQRDDKEGYASVIENLEPVVNETEISEEYFNQPDQPTDKKNKVLASLDSMWSGAKKLVKRDTEAEHAPIEELVIDDHEEVDEAEKIARRNWKEAHPTETIKQHRQLHQSGSIDNLPWMHPDYHPGLTADNAPTTHAGEVKGFGTNFPTNAVKGDMFLRVDSLPSKLYKFNGGSWIEVDKTLSDQYAYDTAYIDHLIEKISTGEYDPDLLSDAEQESIKQRLNNKQV